MTRILACLACVVCVGVSSASAQAPIIIGPNSVLAWDNLGVPVATATTFTVNATVDALAPKVLTGVTCVAGVAPLTASDSTCSAPLSQIPTGSHSVTLTNTTGSITSLPSTPFAYVTILIPVPSSIRVK